MTSRHRILEADRKHIWRPYTSSEDHVSRDPFVIKRSQGVYLEDYDGRRYLDGNASWWTNNLGHGHPRLLNALCSQAETLMHCAMANTTHEQAAFLAEELVAIAPQGITRAFFSDDGSTAVEVAVKMAYQYWMQNGREGRSRFISLGGAFHGDTLGAMSVSGITEFHGVFGPLLFERIQTPFAADEASWDKAIATLEKALASESDSIAGVIVEPMVQGATGMRVWSAEQLKRVSTACQKHDTFFIADEVFVGLGRTGTMWACDHAGVAPDILCSAKSLSGGVLPFAATLTTERVFDGFRGDKTRALMHGHTFYGNPLGARIAREVLAIYRDEDVLGGIAERAAIFRDCIAAITRIPGIRDARTLGMVAAVDLGDIGYLGDIGWRVCDAARERGAYVRPLGNTTYLTPSLNIPIADLKSLTSIWHDAIAEVMAQRS